MIRLAARVRAGFTLVEMLVVLVIISILAALITAAAANAMWAAKQTRIKIEVDMLAGALEAFKQKYNSYPPTNLSCPPDGNSLAAANPQLTAFVARAFPRYVPVTMNGGSPPALMNLQEQIGYDLTYGGGSVLLPNQNAVNPQNALAFWLSGFTSDPTDPFNRTGNPAFTRSSFFSFDQTRLLDGVTGAPAAQATSSTVGTPFGHMIYNAPYGNTAYCYFDYQTYGTLVNNYTGTPVYGAAATYVAGTPAAGDGIVYANSTGVQLDLGALAPFFVLGNGTGNAMPYISDVNLSGTLNAGDTFCKPTSFQIISAGQDGCFGTLVAPAYGRLYPTGLNYDVPPPTGGSGDDDNVTNFCEKNSLESAKP